MAYLLSVIDPCYELHNLLMIDSIIIAEIQQRIAGD